MSVLVDTSTEHVRSDTTSPQTFSHSGASSGIKGVLLAITHGTSATDHVSAASYGGSALAKIVRTTRDAGELGAVEWWFLGSSIPQGTQTVSYTPGSTTDVIHAVAITLLADDDLDAFISSKIHNKVVADPKVTLFNEDRETMAFAALYSGDDAGAFTPNGNCTTVHSHDFGAFSSVVFRQTTAASGEVEIGGTLTSDDIALAVVGVSEVVPAGYYGTGGSRLWGALVDDQISGLLDDASPVTGVPLTIAVWFKPSSCNMQGQHLVSLGQSSGGDNLFVLGVGDVSNSGTSVAMPVLAGTRTGGTSFATSTASITDNDWHHCCGVWHSATDRRAYLDGANEGTESTSVIPTSPTHMRVGFSNAFARGVAGYMAHVALWNVALSSAEVAQLAAGASPLSVQRANLVRYLYRMGDSTVVDVISGRTFTITGTERAAEEAPVDAAVVVDTSTEHVRTDTASPQTFSHAAAAAEVKGVLLAIIHGTSNTDHVSAASYGGVAMSRDLRAIATTAEPGAAEWWFLGSSVPQGTQTVSYTPGATTDVIHATCITLLGGDDLEILIEGMTNQKGITLTGNPFVTFDYEDRTAMAFAAAYSGVGDVSLFTPNGNCTLIHDHDFGSFVASVFRQTTASSGEFQIGATATGDDLAFAALAISEVVAADHYGTGGSRRWSGHVDGTEGLTDNAVPTTDPPFSVALWFKTNVLCLYDMTLWEMGQDASSNDLWRLQLDTSLGEYRVEAAARAAGTSGALSTAGILDFNWHHLAGVWNSHSDRRAYLDGGNEGLDTVSRDPGGTANEIRIGFREDSTNNTIGRQAHLAMWNVALSPAEIAFLATGASPFLVQRANLVQYLYRMGATTVVDVISGRTFTVTGTVTAVARPQMDIADKAVSWLWGHLLRR